MENNTYTLIIKNDTSEKGSKSPIANVKSTPKQETASTDKGALAVGLMAIQKVKPYIMQGVNYAVERVSIASGSNEYSARLRSAVSVVSQGVDMLSDIALGAVVGGGPGTVVGTFLTVGKTAASAIMKASELSLKKQVEEAALEIARRRAGVSGSR